MKARFVLGVVLGQAHDFTALVVLERAGTELHAHHLERLLVADWVGPRPRGHRAAQRGSKARPDISGEHHHPLSGTATSRRRLRLVSSKA